MNQVKKYFAIAKTAFKSQLAYRFDVAMDMLFTVTKILFAYLLWSAVFDQQEQIAGFTFQSMLLYYILSSFFDSLMNMTYNLGNEISDRIRNGTFSNCMVIPYRAESYFHAHTVGATAFYFLFDLAAVVLWCLLFRIPFVLAADAFSIVSAICLLFLGFLFMMQLHFFLGILTLLFENIRTFLILKDNLLAFLSGSLLPLALLPGGILSLMCLFPFYYVIYLPSMLLLGKGQEEAISGIVILLLWILAFAVINKKSFQRLRIRYDGVGI